MTAPWLKKGEVAAGDQVRCQGFGCIEDGARRQVQADDDGSLFVACAAGRHALAGQLDGGGAYVGVAAAADAEADPGIRFTTFAGIAIALAALFYFGGQLLVRGWAP